MTDYLLLITAFSLGFLGSPHCVGMCGGIVGVLHSGVVDGIGNKKQQVLYGLAFNSGRLLSYAIAGMIAAGLHGIQNGAAGPTPYLGNAYEDTSLDRVPGTLGEAIEAFHNSDVTRTALSAEVHDHLLNFFSIENDAFLRRCVTDWERARYFERI